jgi:oleate hydratase
MKAHIVGGGFGGLAAAALLIRNADVPGANITIYEADDVLGGGFFLGGSAASGFNLPGSVFDKEFRCTFDLLKSIPSARDSSISVTEDFFRLQYRRAVPGQGTHPRSRRPHRAWSALRPQPG